MNKSDILSHLESEREAILEILETIPQEHWLTPGVVGEWSIKDILFHLSRWEAELIKLLWELLQEQKPSTLQLTQKNVDITNQDFYLESRFRSLERVLDDFHAVRNQTILRVETFTDKELNDTKRFPWLKERPLWEWIASDSFEHEKEHAPEIAAWGEKLVKRNE
jgi:hypothetical protein